jgi:hypothetical protein
MRIFLIALATCLVFVSKTKAQVTVDLVLDEDQFLPRESLRIGVRITNFSGQSLQFGAGNDWVRFIVERADGILVPQQGEIPVEGEFDVDSSTVATKRVDIAPYFNLVTPGRYQISATVRIKQWEKDLVTTPKDFDIIAGTKLWEQEIGVPARQVAGRPPEVRKYALQQAMHLKQMKLYVRVTDEAELHYYGVFPLGPLVSFSVPEHQIDRTNNLHVLHQTGARSFSYSVVDPDGKRVIKQTHDYSASRPVLRAGPDGQVVVLGGSRRIAMDDIPPPREPAALTNEVPKLKP